MFVFHIATTHSYYRGYRHYGYDPSGAIIAGAAPGILGAGIGAASQPYYGYGYPRHCGYGWVWCGQGLRAHPIQIDE